MRQLLFHTALVLGCLLLPGCGGPGAEASFYFWRTTANFSADERGMLDATNSKVLYTRLFDIGPDPQSGKPVPMGVLKNLDQARLRQDLVPVVFIVNRTFVEMPDSAVPLLARQVQQKIDQLLGNAKLRYTELQFDCDWSDRTQASYFQFLQEIRKLLKPGVKLSATIRLHQVKYRVRTGIPPVDKGMLMFYNMGDLKATGRNSIYNADDAQKYTAYLGSYPLHLDVALPVFSWLVHTRKGKIIALLSKDRRPDECDTLHFSAHKTGEAFVVRESFLNDGMYYTEGDSLRPEQLSADELLQAAALLKANLKEEERRVVFFDLDQHYINLYGKENFEKILAVFN